LGLSPILLVAALTGTMAQQDEPAPQAEEPQSQEADTPEPQAEPPSESEEPGKKYNGLYIEAGFGSWSTRDIDSSIDTGSRARAENNLSIDEQSYARAAIGWKLNRNKGDFRLIFNGWSEDTYALNTQGLLQAVDPALQNVPVENVADQLFWWELQVDDGRLMSARYPPQWDINTDDTNGNGLVDDGEQQYFATPDQMVVTETFKSLDNRAQTIDFVFGNVWGPRRFQGRWFAGARYFVYEGNILAPAWLTNLVDGQGFTDGAFLNLVNFTQETTGFGPTGLLEARFNFFDQRFQLFITGQASFMIEKLETSSGNFLTLVTNQSGLLVTAPASLSDSQSKSTWHTAGSVGARLRLRNGLKFELAYSAVGLLDAILLPDAIRVPETPQEAPQGTSAIFNTQDYVLDGWTASMAFQF
jgi:hypothetical protein